MSSHRKDKHDFPSGGQPWVLSLRTAIRSHLEDALVSDLGGKATTSHHEDSDQQESHELSNIGQQPWVLTWRTAVLSSDLKHSQKISPEGQLYLVLTWSTARRSHLKDRCTYLWPEVQPEDLTWRTAVLSSDLKHSQKISPEGQLYLALTWSTSRKSHLKDTLQTCGEGGERGPAVRIMLPAVQHHGVPAHHSRHQVLALHPLSHAHFCTNLTYSVGVHRTYVHDHIKISATPHVSLASSTA